MLAKIINTLEEGIIAFLLAAMTVITFVQVVLRYVFNAGLDWALELTIYLFAWLVLLGMSYGVRVHAHIGIDLLVKNLSPQVGKVVGGIAVALCMLYAALLFKGGWDDIALLYLIGIEAQDIPLPVWMLKLIMPLGFALLFIRFAQAGWELVTGRGPGLRLADEADEAIEHLKHEHQYPEDAEDKKYKH